MTAQLFLLRCCLGTTFQRWLGIKNSFTSDSINLSSLAQPRSRVEPLRCSSRALKLPLLRSFVCSLPSRQAACMLLCCSFACYASIAVFFPIFDSEFRYPFEGSYLSRGLNKDVYYLA